MVMGPLRRAGEGRGGKAPFPWLSEAEASGNAGPGAGFRSGWYGTARRKIRSHPGWAEQRAGCDMGRSIDGLSPEERLNHYRLLAESALEKARTATTEELRIGFLTMANSWHVLAAEMERQVEGGVPPDLSDEPSTGSDRERH